MLVTASICMMDTAKCEIIFCYDEMLLVTQRKRRGMKRGFGDKGVLLSQRRLRRLGVVLRDEAGFLVECQLPRGIEK